MPRLRFDRVVVELAGRLQSDLRELVPRRQTVMITITARILQPGATAAATMESVRHRLESRPARLEISQTLFGNGVRVSLMGGVGERVPKALLFAHNPGPQTDVPGVLFGLARWLVGRTDAGAAGRGKPKRGRGDRWLILVPEGGRPLAAGLRHILSQLCIPAGFSRVRVVRSGGRVQALEAGP